MKSDEKLRETRKGFLCGALGYFVVFTFILLSAFLASNAQALTVHVVDETGAPITGGFRWLLEEDTTHPVVPGARVTDSLSMSIHRSTAPVIAKGNSGTAASASIVAPVTGRYALSVLPNATGYTVGGANIKIGQTVATVTVNKHNVQTAQLSVLVFHDNNPINNAPDVLEPRLANFTVLIFDQFGAMSQDAFGYPLGTEYTPGCDVNTLGDACVTSMGNGVILTDVNGEALIKNLAPGKYGVRVVPDAAHANWVQNNTIEGSPGIDAWIKAGEPTKLIEFGTAMWHTFYGFVPPTNELGTIPIPVGGSAGTVTGRIVMTHQPRPPDVALYQKQEPIGECWIGLNTTAGAAAVHGVYVAPCNADGTFTINSVPPGTYQIVIWDRPLDVIFGFRTVTVPSTGGTIAMGDIAVNMWFGTLEGSVFHDANENGMRDPGEGGIHSQAINLRFRDGSIYQATVTDITGAYELAEVFPFFKFLITEVDFLRYKATGATIVVDDGGPIPADNGWTMPSEGKRNPQRQLAAEGGNRYRIELSLDEAGFYAPVLLEAIELNADQNIRIDWGKKPYPADENGGIAGIVYYGVTRAENDPKFGTGETWEPGIARVQTVLYEDLEGDGLIDDIDGVPGIQLADVDNYPFGWADGLEPKGAEDQVRCGDGINFCTGDAIAIAWSDAWDDNLPDGCVDSNGNYDTSQVVYGVPIMNCAETMQTWNQVRPALFDGGYAFPGENGLPPGAYIVEAVPPPGYEIQKEENKNVDFGDSYVPAFLPPPCVGTFANTGIHHIVPQYLTLFTDQQIPAWNAGLETPLCNMKKVIVENGKNAAADFHMFTEVPKSARAVGLITNDLGLTAPGSALFQEKLSPSWIPVSFRDFNGMEITRVYSDEFGLYNALLPSTYTINPPIPTGVSPHMIDVCLNHPGPIPDPNNPGQFITDPNFKSTMAVACYTLDFWPGKTTYLDTPVIPVSAFTGAMTTTLDCEFPNGTPVLHSATGPGAQGPVISTGGGTITILSVGPKAVPNPAYNPLNPGTTPANIVRDFGFGGTKGTVKIGNYTVTAANTTWATDGLSISVVIPNGAVPAGPQQLLVTRGDNKLVTPVGVTIHVTGGAYNPAILQAGPGRTYPTIQAAVDAAGPGSIVMVAPGVYNENVVMGKNIKLQGWGAGSTVINAFQAPGLATAWHTRVDNLLNAGLVSLAPGQSALLQDEENAGIAVFSPSPTANQTYAFTAASPARIDGLTVKSANTGGGIMVNGYAHYLEITNNTLINNMGSWGGGIRVGTPTLTDASCGVNAFCSSQNDNMKIHHNLVAGNGQSGAVFGGTDAGAGGVSFYNGSDNYQLTENFICGNFSTNNGGGVAHYGKSTNGLIAWNKIIFNEASFGANANGGHAGGILVSGELPPAPQNPGPPPGNLTPGTGSVTINANLIQGNLAGAGLGGGIDASLVNGQDVFASPTNNANWHHLKIFNNMIVNNIAGYAGGGIGLQDVAKGDIRYNTIAYNDSTATAAAAFPGALLISTPQAAGIVSAIDSANLCAAKGSGICLTQTFSNPTIDSNILYRNRSFYFDGTLNGGAGALVANPISPYWDLTVMGSPQIFGPLDPRLNPTFCEITSIAGYPLASSNVSVANVGFAAPYFNTLTFSASAGEGGNFIMPFQDELSLNGNYHILGNSQVRGKGNGNKGGFAELNLDYDNQARQKDIGADQFSASYSISGKVALANGTGIAGVTMTLGGASAGTTVTDAAGNYSFAGLFNGSYTVTPSLTGYTFTPVSRNVTINNGNVQAQNFTGAGAPAGTFSISGTVTTSNGLPIYSGVTMTLGGAANATTTTDLNGNYTFIGLANGNYTVTPSKIGYTFTPPNRAVTINGANVLNQNFIAFLTPTFSISGTVTDSLAGGIQGVTMSLGGAAAATTTTDVNGNYTFTGLADGNYTVTPSLTSYTFTPPSLSVAIAGADALNQNFTGTIPCAFAINPVSQNFADTGGAGSVTVTVTAGVGCSWTAVSNAAWITVTGGAAGTGNGTVTYNVDANAGAARTGTITIAGLIFTVNQSPFGCTYAINPTTAGILAAGGNGSVAVTAGAGCPWTAVSNAAWISVTGGAAGTGNGTVNYSVAANAGIARTGTITIAGLTFTVNQLAAGGGGYTVTGKTFTNTGAKLGNVLMTLVGPVTLTVISQGEYKFTGVPPGTYTLTPSRAGYVFTPPSRTFTITNNNLGNQNFIGTQQ